LHDKLHFSAAEVLTTLGLITLAATIYITWLLPDRAVRLVLWCAAQVLFKVRVQGPGAIPRTGPALIVSNHVSYADAVLIALGTPRFIRFLMWQRYFDVKPLRWFYRLVHAIPLNTESPRAAARALLSARQE